MRTSVSCSGMGKILNIVLVKVDIWRTHLIFLKLLSQIDFEKSIEQTKCILITFQISSEMALKLSTELKCLTKIALGILMNPLVYLKVNNYYYYYFVIIFLYVIILNPCHLHWNQLQILQFTSRTTPNSRKILALLCYTAESRWLFLGLSSFTLLAIKTEFGQQIS